MVMARKETIVTAIHKLGLDKVQKKAIDLARKCNIEHLHIDYILYNIDRYKSLANTISITKSDRITDDSSDEDLANTIIKKWVQKIHKAYNKRISVRESKTPGTSPDSLINHILKTRLQNLSESQIMDMIFAHRAAMSAENILGLLLEEYIWSKLDVVNNEKRIWVFAWGDVIKAVDLCSNLGDLIQIKNRDNSENSSSQAVRNGTTIQKWFRIKAKTGETQWPRLCRLIGCDEGIYSEDDFKNFVFNTISHNPKAMAIEPNNTWQNYSTVINRLNVTSN